MNILDVICEIHRDGFIAFVITNDKKYEIKNHSEFHKDGILIDGKLILYKDITEVCGCDVDCDSYYGFLNAIYTQCTSYIVNPENKYQFIKRQ